MALIRLVGFLSCAGTDLLPIFFAPMARIYDPCLSTFDPITTCRSSVLTLCARRKRQ